MDIKKWRRVQASVRAQSIHVVEEAKLLGEEGDEVDYLS